MTKTVIGKPRSEWVREFPIIDELIQKKENLWINAGKLPFAEAIKSSSLGAEDIKDASARLDRFASYFKKVFQIGRAHV